MRIVIDTREKKALNFRIGGELKGTVVKKLDVGDYSFMDGETDYSEKISIERKSAADLYGTMGKGNRRFKRELIRAKDYDYFAIVVEESYSTVRDRKFEGSRFTEMWGATVLKTCFTFSLKYGINVFFCNGPLEASSLIRCIFTTYLTLKEKGFEFTPLLRNL